LLGPEGLARVANESHRRANELVAALVRVKGVKLAFERPRFHEAVLQLDRPVAPVLAELARRGIVGGFDLSTDYPELGNALLVCATETRSSEIEKYANALTETLKAPCACLKEIRPCKSIPKNLRILTSGRGAAGRWPTNDTPSEIAADVPRICAEKPAMLPELGELSGAPFHQAVAAQLLHRHAFLSPGIMRWYPKACNAFAMLPGFLNRHPLAPDSLGQGFLACMFELQEMLKEVTGMQGVALSPMAGAHGEFAGVAMIRAYHRARGDLARNEIIVPQAAHGTNPATATMCGCVVKEIPVNDEGDVDVEALKTAVGPNTAGIMLTNPSTCGVFERRIKGSGESCTTRAACCTTTAPTSTPSSARYARVTWASTSYT
jgi:glycine cleavage system protein P-like pyridoxal-binding family